MKITNDDCYWPEIILNPDVPFHPEMSEDVRRAAAIADQLSAYGNCYAGHKPPETFGMGMLKLARITQCDTVEDLMSAAKALNLGAD